MLIITETNVLTVGISEGQIQALRELPVRVINVRYGNEAVRSFKSKNINSVVSQWSLDDMPDGALLKGVRSIKPDLPTIAIIESGNTEQEIEARSLGVSAVLTENCGREELIEVLANLLGIADTQAIASIYAEENTGRETNI